MARAPASVLAKLGTTEAAASSACIFFPHRHIVASGAPVRDAHPLGTRGTPRRAFNLYERIWQNSGASLCISSTCRATAYVHLQFLEWVQNEIDGVLLLDAK